MRFQSVVFLLLHGRSNYFSALN